MVIIIRLKKHMTLKTSTLQGLLAFLILGSSVFFLGNSSGPAANDNFFTGAPSAGGGTEQTCNTCHRSGNFGEPQIAVTLTTADGTEAITEYVPGETYSVTVAIGHNDVVPAGYGFSSQFVNTEAGAIVNVGTPANPDANTRITNGSNGRTYVEQRQRNVDSLFTFEWTAPEAGTGAIEYYVSGNLINNAGGTSGDSGSSSPTVVQLAEGNPSSVRNLARLNGSISPNPAVDVTTLRLDVPAAATYQLRIVSMTGRVLRQQTEQLIGGPVALPIATNDLPAGLYALSLTGAGSVYTGRLIVR